MAEAEPKVYTPQQIADILQVRVRTIMEYLRTGRLKGIRVGRLWRIRQEDLEAFLEPSAQSRFRVSQEDATIAQINEAIDQDAHRP